MRDARCSSVKKFSPPSHEVTKSFRPPVGQQEKPRKKTASSAASHAVPAPAGGRSSLRDERRRALFFVTSCLRGSNSEWFLQSRLMPDAILSASHVRHLRPHQLRTR